MPIGRVRAEAISIRKTRGRSPFSTRQFLANQIPPSSSRHITIGITNTKGKKPMSIGAITMAPPKPERRRNKPAKRAQNANRNTKNQSTVFKQYRLNHAHH
jgi:hypothetical protein